MLMPKMQLKTPHHCQPRPKTAETTEHQETETVMGTVTEPKQELESGETVSEAMAPEATETEAIAPEVTEPAAMAPEAMEPEALAPEATETEEGQESARPPEAAHAARPPEAALPTAEAPLPAHEAAAAAVHEA